MITTTTISGSRRLELLEDLDAGSVGQHEVEQHEVDLVLLGQAQAPRPR